VLPSSTTITAAGVSFEPPAGLMMTRLAIVHCRVRGKTRSGRE
jgi:hypothetical protein